VVVSSDETAEIDWYLRIPEGVLYGPVCRLQLDRWVREGRVSVGCKLRRVSGEQWLAAESVYPDLEIHAVQGNFDAGGISTPGVPQLSSDPFINSALASPIAASARKQLTHRAALVLTFAIVGIFVPCPVFSFMAWNFGTQDLHDMEIGLMDRAGYRTTALGRQLGMAMVFIWGMISLVAAVLGTIYWAAN
jgi:hypothetical protein